MINKIQVILLIFLILGGCSKQTTEVEIEKDEEKNFIEPSITEKIIDIGLYLNAGDERALLSSYDSSFEIYTDIISLEVYLTNEKSLPRSTQKELWNMYYQNYSDIDDYKIGYKIEFDTSYGIISKMILNPSDTEDVFDYIQIYLYDDINQESAWYSHVTESDVTENTIYSSVKLIASTKIEEVVSFIKVTVFIYNSDELDDDGNYLGNSSYQVTINKSE